jgi:short-subunit dehydrogenase
MSTVTVITGASSGIGSALAKELAREGHRLVLAARREDRLGELERELRATGGTVLAVRCDVSNRDEAEELIHRTVREFGGIDVLVNNAGRGHFSSVEDTTDEMIENMFAVNVYALWYTTRPALRYMRARGSGHIINVASIAGKIAFPYNSAYVAAKHACVGFTHALRLELAETGIYASVVCPAGVMTEWATATEGGSILEMFSASGPDVKRIAAERGATLPPIEGVLPAAAVAGAIASCIRAPVAEVYTHRGSHEFVVLSAQSREEAEGYQVPVALGERPVYERLKHGK